MGYEANNLCDMPPIICDLYDMDIGALGESHDYLSRCLLQVEDLETYVEGEGVPRPTWYPCYFKKGGEKSGELLMSFAIVEDDFNFKHQPRKVNIIREAGIKMKDYQVTINLLGLRNLQSTGLLPVKKASILFNLKTMVSPAQAGSVENMKTEPSAPGADPTLNTLIEFLISLPTDELYCPRMACKVFDNIMAGFSQPILGNFVVPIGDLIVALIIERKEEIEAIEEVIEELKQMAAGEKLAIALKNDQEKNRSLSQATDGAI